LVFYRYAVLWSFMYRTCCGYHARYTTDYWPVGVCDCAKFGSRYVVVKECEMTFIFHIIKIACLVCFVQMTSSITAAYGASEWWWMSLCFIVGVVCLVAHDRCTEVLYDLRRTR
jgi:hypothetical protein